VEPPIEREAPSVIPAAEHLGHGVSLGDQVPPVGADVGEAVEPILRVPGEEEGLVQESLEEGDWVDLSGHPNPLEVGEELPGTDEHPLPQ
jgi:hypothetical protein